MLASLGRAPFDNPAWVYEPKWDGFRAIAMMRGGSVQLLSRNLHPFTNLFRPIAEALKTDRACMSRTVPGFYR